MAGPDEHADPDPPTEDATQDAERVWAATRALRERPVRTAIVAGLLVAVLALGGLWFSLFRSTPADSAPARPGQRPQTEGPASGAARGGTPAPLTPGRGLLLGTPIYDGDFADPFVLTVGDTLYAYATNTTDAHLPVIVIRSAREGTFFGDAFPDLPSWSEPGSVWAPAVYAHDDGYVLYYSTKVATTGLQCVSRAVSTSPTGPFVDDSAAPFVCQAELGGTIDPSVVVDGDGQPWLLFKSDGNCCGLPTSIWSARLSDDGLETEGEYHRLLTAEDDWEGDLIEAPSMLVDGDTYYLFYSANAWDTSKYAIGYATCRSPAGPCTRAEGPWKSSTPITRGPGGQEFFSALDQVWMVYAAWERGQIGYPEGARRLYLDVVEIHDGVPERVGSRRAGLVVVAAIGLLVAAGAALVLWLRRRRRRRGSSVDRTDASDVATDVEAAGGLDTER